MHAHVPLPAAADGVLFAPPQVWDAASGTENCTLRGHSECVYSCAFSPDGKLIVSASGDSPEELAACGWAATGTGVATAATAAVGGGGGGGGGEVAALRAELAEAQAEAAKWKTLHGEFQKR